MEVWFAGDSEIRCAIQDVKDAVANLGEYYVGVVSLMPGMTRVELIDQGSDFVTIETNEGLMKRSKISSLVDADSVAVEFDEEYQAGSKVTATSHFLHEFSTASSGVTHRLIISDLRASGFLGFFYRRFGSSRMGKAFLNAHRTYFEAKR